VSTNIQGAVADYVFLLHDVSRPPCHTRWVAWRGTTRARCSNRPRAFFEEGLGTPGRPGDKKAATSTTRVRTPSGYLAGYAALCEAGWNRVSVPEESGGAGLPQLIDQAVHEFSASACIRSPLCALTAGAHATLRRTGEPWMLEHVVPAMVAATGPARCA